MKVPSNKCDPNNCVRFHHFSSSSALACHLQAEAALAKQQVPDVKKEPGGPSSVFQYSGLQQSGAHTGVSHHLSGTVSFAAACYVEQGSIILNEHKKLHERGTYQVMPKETARLVAVSAADNFVYLASVGQADTNMA